MNKPAKTIVSRVCTMACIGLLGLGLASCSAGEAAPTDTATITEPASATAAPETTHAANDPVASIEATAESSTAVAERKVTLEVTGSKSKALVKALVITHDGKETGGKMVEESLPFTKDLTLPADTTFTKILVLGKYAEGGTDDISCSIIIDGTSASKNSSTSHKPAECLFIEKDARK